MKRLYFDQCVIQEIKHCSNSSSKELKNWLNNNSEDYIIPFSIPHLSDLSRSQDESIGSQVYLEEDLDFLSKITKDHCLLIEKDLMEIVPGMRSPRDIYCKKYLNRQPDKRFEFDEIFPPENEQLKELFGQISISPDEGVEDIFKVFLKYSRARRASVFSRSINQATPINLLKDLLDYTNLEKGEGYLSIREVLRGEGGLRSDKEAWKNPVVYLEGVIQKSDGISLMGYIDKLVNLSGGIPCKFNYIFTLFLLLDQYGFKSDKKYENLKDDAAHSVYASYCDYFVTSDERLKAKARAVYQFFEISTKVVSPREFSIIKEGEESKNSVGQTFFQNLREELEKMPLKNWTDKFFSPLKIFGIKVPIWGFFNRMQLSNEDEIKVVSLYKRGWGTYENFLFERELKELLGFCVFNFGFDFFGNSVLLNGEFEEYKTKTWKGRKWMIGNNTAIFINRAKDCFGITLTIKFFPIAE